MKHRLLTIICALSFALTSWGGNTVTSVEQVTSAIQLTEDVDYVITSTEPFTSTGSVDIVNTDHAVLIFKNIKPSVVIKSFLKFVSVNGKAAKNGTTCQVKMYAQGAIVMPYSSGYRPLTVFSDQNFEGSSYNAFSLGNNGGYMNNIVTAWNNKIRSFKLKRGYMVTFAVGKVGWGYSRCFIADKEDLEIATLPSVLDEKISSYRIFQWYDAQKKGLASNGDKNANAALNTSWCYDWGQGNATLLPDVEWVPNHIYEDWPSSATCGGVTGSCHMKTNNEPRNSSDDHPQDLETILNNWENLMRTGMRLCSPSSWDGSDYWNGTGFIKGFLEEIDARGWRCDLVDAHCYWNEGNFGYLESQWWPSMRRPIWVSEWIWGASWNKNGAFGSGVTDTQILEATKRILTTLNNSAHVERYAYWNSESKAHIYENGKLTALGEYYAQMETGIGYNKAYEFVPKVVYKEPSKLTGTYEESTGVYKLTWTDPNGDMLDSIIVECKLPETTKWIKIGDVTPKDKSSKNDISYTFSDTPEGNGTFAYRVTEYYTGKKLITNEASLVIAASNYVGALQYGELSISNDETVKVGLSSQETAPYVVMGMISNKNSANGIANQVVALNNGSFTFRFFPWRQTTAVEFKNSETIDYISLPADKIYHFDNGMMLISQNAGNIKGDEVEVTFPEAFPDGVIPVVVAQQNSTATNQAPVTVKVYDITNKGFKVKLERQQAETGTFSAQNVNYFAATPGQIAIGNGKLLTVGRNNETRVGGTARQNVAFKNQAGDTLYLKNPFIVAASQTNNYGKASIFRQHMTSSTDDGVYLTSIRRQVDATNTTETATNSASVNGDYIGWFVISDDPNGTGEEAPLIITTGIEQNHFKKGLSYSLAGRAIYVTEENVHIYTTSGMPVAAGTPLPKGVYVISNGHLNVKVQVK